MRSLLTSLLAVIVISGLPPKPLVYEDFEANSDPDWDCTDEVEIDADTCTAATTECNCDCTASPCPLVGAQSGFLPKSSAEEHLQLHWTGGGTTDTLYIAFCFRSSQFATTSTFYDVVKRCTADTCSSKTVLIEHNNPGGGSGEWRFYCTSAASQDAGSFDNDTTYRIGIKYDEALGAASFWLKTSGSIDFSAAATATCDGTDNQQFAGLEMTKVATVNTGDHWYDGVRVYTSGQPGAFDPCVDVYTPP